MVCEFSRVKYPERQTWAAGGTGHETEQNCRHARLFDNAPRRGNRGDAGAFKGSGAEMVARKGLPAGAQGWKGRTQFAVTQMAAA
jgi:hypothetical protein